MTNTSQSTSNDPFGDYRAETALIEVTVAILISLSATFGNSLVVYVISKVSRLRNDTNLFILNLALTDIAMGTIYMPFQIANLCTGVWNFSQVWCQMTGSILFILAYASIFTMGLIAFNRYIKVLKPTLYRKLFPSKRAARMYCVLIWLFSILLDIPLLTSWVRFSYDEKLNQCKLMSYAYPTFTGPVFTCGVMIAIFYCYYKIYKAVKESTDNLNVHAEGNGAHSSNDSRRSNITDVKVSKVCFTVACFYVITWCPVSIVAGTGISRFAIGQKFSKVSVYLMFSGSVVNPFIYGFMNPQFKQAFKRILSCGWYGNENTDQSHSRNRVG